MAIVSLESLDLKKLLICDPMGKYFKKADFMYYWRVPVVEVTCPIRFYNNCFGRSIGIRVKEGSKFLELEKVLKRLAYSVFEEGIFDLIKKNKKGDLMIYCKADDKIGVWKSNSREYRAKLNVRILYAFSGKTSGFKLEARDVVIE